MRRFAAVLSAVLTLAACTAEPAGPEGFEPAGMPTPKADGDGDSDDAEGLTPCHAVDECIVEECGDALSQWGWCEMPEAAGDEACATVDADLESCVDACAAKYPDASEDDVALALAHHQCGILVVTAEDERACKPLAVECHGFE